VPELLLNDPKVMQVKRKGQIVDIHFTDEMIGKIIRQQKSVFYRSDTFYCSDFVKDSLANKARVWQKTD